jgi:hypothetical protein
MKTYQEYTTKPEITAEQKWSNSKMGIPSIGDRVHATCNSYGPSTVIGYFTEAGWIGVLVMPDKCPGFYMNQNKEAFKNPDLKTLLRFCFFGAEIRPTTVPAPEFDASHQVALAIVKAKHRTWRQVLQDAWMSGNYYRYDLDGISGILQRIRNSHTGCEFAFGKTS